MTVCVCVCIMARATVCGCVYVHYISDLFVYFSYLLEETYGTFKWKHEQP